VSPLRGEKPQNRPLSTLNNGRFALRAMLPVNIELRRGYDHTCKSMWRCDNVGGLGEHVTCHMLRSLTLFLGHAEPPQCTDGLILTISTSHDMFLRKEVPFGGRDETAPHLGVKPLPPKKVLGRE